MFSIIRNAPLNNDNVESKTITTNRNFEIVLGRQNVRRKASGPPYIAGEVIINTARASDSIP
jgi:hypothetical protein